MAKVTAKGCLGGIGAFLCGAFGLLLLLALPRACATSLNDEPSCPEPLPPSAVVKTPYYADEDGGWIRYPNQLVTGMRAFQDETGVQPYLHILSDGASASSADLDRRAQELYGELFEDEAHFLVVFCDDGRGSYFFGYAVGEKARELVGDEAIAAFEEEFDEAYYRYSTRAFEEQMFSEAFEKAGTVAMGEYRGAERVGSALGVFIAFSLTFLLAVALLGVAALYVYALVKRRKNKEERISRLMSEPLRKFSDARIERLARKYEDSPGDDGGPAPRV
ncbi:hypothetical protein [Arabiibacter massiliensis]|uniref:hypothetical protein n=1 Tax=Arabiibacter massiliensis TaxID=1870985 RepID=UPI0009BB0BF8|nr:hypothetical protein [Arabiibacter massiliensis]